MQLLRTRDELVQLATVAPFLQALEEDPATRGHVGQMVGTAFPRRRVDSVLLVEFLVDLIDETRSFDFDESTFQWVASRLLSFLATREIQDRHIVQLVGVIGPDAAVELGDGATLRPLEDEEAGRLLAYGLIPDGLGLPSTMSPIDRLVRRPLQHSVAATSSLLKVIGEQPPEHHPPPDTRARTSAERLVTAIRIQHGGAVALGPSIHIPGGWRPLAWRGGMFGYGEPMPQDQPVTLTKDGWNLLRPLYEALSHPSVGNRLEIPLRRLRQACLRTHPEDRLVDLMIAAEALFLSGELNESRFKLAVRSSSSTGVAGHSSSAVFEFMKKAYRFRSKVVHGEHPKGLIRLGGESTNDLKDVVADLEIILRSALAWAVQALASGHKIDDWDAPRRPVRPCAEA
ncbi:MAG: hypothetical protein ACR2NT_04695 [Acidimicrobiia bacterium]